MREGDESSAWRESDAKDQSPVPPEAQDAVGLALLLIALILLALTPLATRSAPAGRGWYLEPRNWPILTLLLVGIPAGVITVNLVRRGIAAADKPAFFRRALWAFRDLGAALEYSTYFIVYLLAISYTGFAVSTLIFGQVCLWRAGLRSTNWALANFALTVILVLGLRVGMGLWFPMAPIFHLLPAWIGNSLGTYL